MEKGHAHQEDTLEDKLGFQKMCMWQRRPLVVLCVTASGLGTEAGWGFYNEPMTTSTIPLCSILMFLTFPLWLWLGSGAQGMNC